MVVAIEHIKTSTFNFDPHLAHKYIGRLKDAVKAGIWMGYGSAWFVESDNNQRSCWMRVQLSKSWKLTMINMMTLTLILWFAYPTDCNRKWNFWRADFIVHFILTKTYTTLQNLKLALCWILPFQRRLWSYCGKLLQFHEKLATTRRSK